MKSEEFAQTTGLPKAEPSNNAARARLPRPVREQQMLDAATEIFGRLGYHSASMDQIADEVGISKPMLYAYFDSKEGLYAACLKRSGSEVVGAVAASYKPEFTPEQALWAGFVAFFQFVQSRPAGWQLVRSESAKEMEAFNEIAASTHDELRGVVSELTKLASTATPADPFADDELRTAAAYAMFGAASAMANRWLDNNCETTPEIFSTQLMNFFWLGFNDMAEGEIWSEGAVDAS